MNENNVTILDLMRSDGYILVNRKLAQSIGLNEAIIYGELTSRYCYFEKHKSLDKSGYFYNTVNDLEDGTTLTKYQQNRAINNLCKLNLIDYKAKDIPAKRYFKVNLNTNILAVIEETSQFTENSPTSLPKNQKQVYRKLDTNNTIINKNKVLEYSTYLQVISTGCFSLDIFKNQIKACYKKLNPKDISFSLKEIFKVVDYFMLRYSEWVNIQHPNLSNETINKILLNISSSSMDFDFDTDSYREMIDFYFTQDFKGNQYGKCDYSFAHFILSDEIRINCFYKSCY